MKIVQTTVPNKCACDVRADFRHKEWQDDKEHKSDYIINFHMPKQNILGEYQIRCKQSRMTNNFSTPSFSRTDRRERHTHTHTE